MENYKEYLAYCAKRKINPVNEAKWLKLHKVGLA